MHYRQYLYQNYFENQAGRRVAIIEQQMRQDRKQLIADIFHLIPKQKDIRILEIGCGYGNLIQTLTEKNYTSVVGIDLSADQIRMAQQLGITNVVCVDVVDFLTKNTQKYDLIIGIDIIEHFTKNELVDLLHLIRNRLTEKGQCIFRTVNMDAIGASLYAYGDFTHETLLNSSSAQQLMQSMGFRQVQIYPSKLLVEGWLKNIIQKTWWPFFVLYKKMQIFATARSTQNVIFTPNIVIHTCKKIVTVQP